MPKVSQGNHLINSESGIHPTLQMVRPQVLAENIVVIDGLSCSGKSLVAPLVSTLERAELWQQNYLYEYLCIMDGFGRVSRDAAVSLVNLYADLDIYNLTISRGASLRPNDISSAHMNLQEDRYLSRLNEPDGDEVVDKIQESMPILPLMTHYILGASDLLFKAFAERLKLFVLPVRHPQVLVELWHARNWHERIGHDPRDFQLCITVAGVSVPWFASDWADEYVEMNSLERSIRTVLTLWNSSLARCDTLSAIDKEKILFIPFESFIQNPLAYLGSIAQRLSTSITALTDPMLLKLNLPRTAEANFANETRRRMNDLVRKNGVLDSGIHQALLDACEEYEARFQ